jgi:hypothetical protein
MQAAALKSFWIEIARRDASQGNKGRGNQGSAGPRKQARFVAPSLPVEFLARQRPERGAFQKLVNEFVWIDAEHMQYLEKLGDVYPSFAILDLRNERLRLVEARRHFLLRQLFRLPQFSQQD